MSYSFPVYRKGMVFKTQRVVSVEEAGRIADCIKHRRSSFTEAFERGAMANNGASGFTFNKDERVNQQIAESYILNFPPISFLLDGYSIRSRNSVTVCMHEHQSKIWTRLTCAAVDGEPAVNLTGGQLRRFFLLATEKSRTILSELTDEYGKCVTAAGMELPKKGKYYFQLRAFNSLNPATADLCARLREDLWLSDALKSKQYQSELLDYFGVVLNLERRASPEDVKKAIKTEKIDVFGYRSLTHDALYAARTTEEQTDICGFGYDDERKNKPENMKNMLAQATTRDLLKEYAQEF